MMPHGLSIMDVPCDAIRIGQRHRKDMGELEVLAASIATEGLLQPIGVTEDNELVFGERRLRAVQEVLRRGTIPARVVRVRSITAGEYAENEIRKDFTLSERDAIRRAVQTQIPERRGWQNPDNCPELKGEETRQIAARKAGFSNYKAAERVAKVVDQGAAELVEAMDSCDVSIHAASIIATQPPERQAEIVKTPRDLRRQIVREIRDAIDLPTTSEARRMARESGMLVADRTGRYRSGASAEERAATKADLDAIWDVTRGVLAIAGTQLDPAELAARLEYWHCPDVRVKTTVALSWLTKFQEGLAHNDQIS